MQQVTMPHQKSKRGTTTYLNILTKL